MKTKPTETAPNPAERARAEVDRLNSAERDLSRRYQSKALELSVARATRGDDVLAANDPSAAARESSRQIAEKVEELAALGDAAAAARRQRMSAIPAVFIAEADELNRQAAQLDSDAAANKAAVDEKRRELAAIAGCDYVPESELAFARRGQLGGGGGSPVVIQVRVPIFTRLQSEASALRLEAAQRRIKGPHKAGSVEADNLEQLVDLVFADAMRVGPSVDQISGWYEQAVDKVRRRRQQLELDDVPITRLHLEWRAGIVDQGVSWVNSQSPAPAAATETEPPVRKNVIFGGDATGKQEVDLQAIDTEAEMAAARATERSA